MFPGNRFLIRQATPGDERTLRHLAELDSRRPLAGPALIGEIDGAAAAALSLTDGRLVADPFRPTADLSQVLRLRAIAARAHSDTPSVRERIRAAIAPFRARHGQA